MDTPIDPSQSINTRTNSVNVPTRPAVQTPSIDALRLILGVSMPSLPDELISRLLRFAGSLERIKLELIQQGRNGTASPAYRDVMGEYYTALNTLRGNVGLPTVNYPSPTLLAAVQAKFTEIAEILDRIIATIPVVNSGPDEQAGVVENFLQLVALHQFSSMGAIRFHIAGEDTSWVQGSLPTASQQDVINELNTHDYIVVNTGPVQTPMYVPGADDNGIIEFPNGFELLLPMENVQSAEALWVIALNPVYSQSSSFIHPNVSSGGLCFGDGSSAAVNALRRGDVLSYFTVVKTILGSYSRSPYHDARDWDRSRRDCLECKHAISLTATGGNALCEYETESYHLSCTVDVAGVRVPKSHTNISAFSNQRFRTGDLTAIRFRRRDYWIATTERDAFQRLSAAAEQDVYICQRCDQRHEPLPGVNPVVSARQGLLTMLGCPLCLRADTADMPIDPRTGERVPVQASPVLRQLLIPAPPTARTPCPSCAALQPADRMQRVVRLDNGANTTTCRACDPERIGLACNEANIPEFHGIVRRFLMVVADPLLFNHITPRTPVLPRAAYDLAAAAHTLAQSGQMSGVFTEPMTSFATKLSVWHSSMESCHLSWTALFLFTATPEQIEQHDHAVTTQLQSLYGSGRLRVAYDPGVDPASVNVLSTPGIISRGIAAGYSAPGGRASQPEAVAVGALSRGVSHDDLSTLQHQLAERFGVPREFLDLRNVFGAPDVNPAADQFGG